MTILLSHAIYNLNYIIHIRFLCMCFVLFINNSSCWTSAIFTRTFREYATQDIFLCRVKVTSLNIILVSKNKTKKNLRKIRARTLTRKMLNDNHLLEIVLINARICAKLWKSRNECVVCVVLWCSYFAEVCVCLCSIQVSVCVCVLSTLLST